MNDWLETLAIGFSTALVFSVPFAFFAFMRYLRYKETVALAERGLLRPESVSQRGRRAHRWGAILIAIGVALTLGLWPIGFMIGANLPLGLGPWLIPGLLPLTFGIALLYLRRLEGPLLKEAESDEGEPEDTSLPEGRRPRSRKRPRRSPGQRPARKQALIFRRCHVNLARFDLEFVRGHGPTAGKVAAPVLRLNRAP